MPDVIDSLLEGGHFARIAEALEAGASPDVRVYGDITALMYACDELVSPECASLLLRHGAAVDARDARGRTALLRFFERTALYEYVSEEEVDTQLRDPDSNASRYMAVPRLLLENGSDPDARDSEGTTALMLCAEGDTRSDFVWMLLESDADPNVLDIRGHPALTRAAGGRVGYTYCGGNRGVVALLADLTSKDLPEPADGVTPVVAAINSANAFALDALREAGYPLALTPPFRHLEPVAAAIAGDMDRLRAALAAGHDIEVRTAPLGRTALMWAAQAGHADMVRFLLERGANLEARGDVFGQPGTALFAAVEGAQTEIVHLLLERGAKPVVFGKTSHIFWVERENNVLQQALDQNDNCPSEPVREICRILWDAVEDKRGVNASSRTAAQLRKCDEDAAARERHGARDAPKKRKAERQQ